MKTLENTQVVKETEKGVLVRSFISELDKELEFWLPKSKVEILDNSIEIEKDFWEEKLEEFKTPKEEDCVFLYVNKFEELEKSYKLFLSAKLKTTNLKPWLFVPKSLVAEVKEMDTDNENGKYYFKLPLWFWEKTLDKLKTDQLEFFNKDREDDEKFKKSDLKLLNVIDE